jgi:aquaporin Z
MRAPFDIVREHWPEYLMEAVGLGLFMISAAVVTALLEYPHSPFFHLLPDPVVRRALIGIAMGLTAIGIIYSPWRKRSGAHLNPAVTVTFFRLGKIQGLDALFFVLAQFVGGLIGLLVAELAFGMAIEHPTVNYVVTISGVGEARVAFVTEVCISFGLVLVVMIVSN